MLAALDTSIVRASLTRKARSAAIFAFAVALVPIAAVRPVLGNAAEPVTAGPVVATAVAPRVVPVAQGTATRTAQRRAASVSPQADTTITRTFNVSRRGTLAIEVGGGTITIEGWNENRVEVRAELSGRDWRDVDFTVEQQGSDVQVAAEYPRNRSTQANMSLTVRVPREYSVDLQSGGGHVSITNVSGRFAGSVGGGDIELASLSGETSLTTGGGTITITDSNLDGTVQTGGGNISLTRVNGDLRPSTGGGRITRDGTPLVVRGLSERYAQQSPNRDRAARTSVYADNSEARSISSSGVVHASRGSGAIEIARAPNGASVSTGSGDIRVGESGGSVSATTGGGAITLGPVTGSVTATTGGGDVSAVVVDAADARVNITTGGGRVVIEIPRDFAGSVTLESGIRPNGDKPKFTTPWNLREETIVTPNNRGRNEPTSNLRATGTIGNGRGEIKVITGGGDIEIRFAR